VIDLSVIVVSWNTRELTLEALAAATRALERSGLRGETILVDNGSRDGTAGAVRRRFPHATAVALPRNLGFAAGANAGLRAAAGRHALLLNSDARPRAGALETCVAYLDAHPRVALLGPRLLRPDGSPEPSVHAAPRLRAELLPAPWRHRPGAGPRDVEAVRGAALFARAEAVRQVGPLPEDYFFFLEETDWCGRMRRAGWQVLYHPGAAFSHVSGASSKRPHPAATRIEYHRSLYRYYGLHHGPGARAAVRAIRAAKAGLRTLAGAPLALLLPRRRARWQSQRALLTWHLRGCPASAGLSGLAQ
jgi:GT2 family glycosyltransferase